MNYEDDYLLNYSDNILINDLEEKVENISLTKTALNETGGITGTVIDNIGNPVNEATVKVFDLAFNPIKHTMTNQEGKYSISNLNPGDYIVYAVKDGYTMSTKIQINITNNVIELENIVIAPNQTYTKGSIYGIVYDKFTKLSLKNVKVTLKSILEPSTVIAETYSAIDGEYVLYNIDAGIYQLSAISDDYVLTAPFNVTVIDNTNLREILYLDKLSAAKHGTISGVVKDEATDVPIEGAFVGLYTVDLLTKEEKLVKITTTDREGKYFFGYVEAGNYIVKAKLTK